MARAEVERGAKRIAFTLVALLTPIADRIAAEFGGLADEREVERRLTAALKDELRRIASSVPPPSESAEASPDA